VFIDSKFRLAILAAKRAKQLASGDRKKIDMNAENPLTIALQEIHDGKISFKIFEKEEFKNLHANSSSDEEDILEALRKIKLEDDYEEINALEEVKEGEEKKQEDGDEEKDPGKEEDDKEEEKD
jgi:DNA-directed RNA polymerase subunit omega